MKTRFIYLIILLLCTSKIYSQSYCKPSPGGWMSMIYHVKTTDGITNINNESGEGVYNNYSDVHYVAANVSDYFTLKINCDYGTEISVYIDWNADGDFDDVGEAVTVLKAEDKPDVEAKIDIPATAKLGFTRMRLFTNIIERSPWDPETSPCGYTWYGEAEDYGVLLLDKGDCSKDDMVTDGYKDIKICSSTPFSLISSKEKYLSSFKYTWQYKEEGEDEWTNIEDYALPFLRMTAGVDKETNFRSIIYCDITDKSDTSDIINVSLKGHTECYCIPVEEYSCESYTMIKGVYTNLAYKNISNKDNGCAITTDNYSDYTSHVLQSFAGSNVDFNIQTGDGYVYQIVWVDWNQNGLFDSDEIVYEKTERESSPFEVLNFSLSIPDDIDTGSYRIRVRSSDSYGFSDPCESTSFWGSSGETEDYTLQILYNPECNEITLNAGTLADMSICKSTPLFMEAKGGSYGKDLDRIWQIKDIDGTTWTDITSLDPINLYYTLGVTKEVSIRTIVNCEASLKSDTSNVAKITLNDPFDCYCEPEVVSESEYAFIIKVSTTDAIENIEYESLYEGYSDMSDEHVIKAKQGIPFELNVKTCESSDPYWCWNTYAKVWIDYNRDGSFSDDEIVYDYSLGAGTMDHKTTVTIPFSSVLGKTKMRVYSHESWIPSGSVWDPCSPLIIGSEVEDYMVDIQKGDNCADPSITFSSDIATHVYPNKLCDVTDVIVSITDELPIVSGLTYQLESKLSTSSTWVKAPGFQSDPSFVVEAVVNEMDFRIGLYCNNEFLAYTNAYSLEKIKVESPEVQDTIYACGKVSVTIPAEGSGNKYWFDKIGGTLLSIGDDYTTGIIENDTFVYVTAGAVPELDIKPYESGSTSWSWTPSPFGVNYENNSLQILYTKDDLEAVGATEGFMSAISFNLKSIAEDIEYKNYTIRIKNYDPEATRFGWQTEGFTVVHESDFKPEAIGWQQFDFANPYYWDGNSSLIVQICYNLDETYWDGGTFEGVNKSDRLLYKDGYSSDVTCDKAIDIYSSELIPIVKLKFNGCMSDYQRVEIIKKNNPIIEIPLDEGEAYCAFNNTFNVNSIPVQDASTRYLWHNGMTTPSIIVPVVGGEMKQLWVSIVDKYGCQASDTVNVIINPSPEVELGEDVTICIDDSLVLKAVSEDVTYTWNTGATTPSITIDQDGRYIVMVTNKFGCIASDTINVTTSGYLPKSDGIKVKNLAKNEFQFEMINPENVVRQLWEFGDGETSIDLKPSHKYDKSGTYEVKVTVWSACGDIEMYTFTSIATSIDNNTRVNDIKIYPNPATSIINIELINALEMDRVQLINVSGQIIYDQKINSTQKHTIDVNRLIDGMYNVVIHSGNEVYTKQVIISKK